MSTDPGMESGSELLRHVIRRNTVILAACLALSWTVVQLMATVAAPVLSELTGRPSLAGLAPAIFLVCWALATLVMGRYMDAHGRGAGIRLGFVAGAAGCVVAFLGMRERMPALFLTGLALAGAGAGAVNLARAGAADMYPPERRARGISFVLIGAAFGAILGPVAFIPLLARTGSDIDVLSTPVVAAALVMLAGGLVTFAMRMDPLDVARQLGSGVVAARPARSVRALLRVPAVRAALFAAIVAQAVMSSMMSTVALILHHHGHGWPTVAISLSAHFLGMFGLVLVIGRLVDRIGRERSVRIGLAVLTTGVLAMLFEVELQWVAPAMFAIGVGWNLAFVAATAMLADATEPMERARLLGFSDFLGYGAGAIGAVLAGVVFGTLGLGALVGFGAGIALLPLVVFAARGRGQAPRRGVVTLTDPEPRC